MKFSTVATLVGRNIEVYARRVLRRNPRPYKVLMELTNHCNSRCQTCSIWKNDARLPQNEMTPEIVENFFRTYGSHLFWLALSGGEITLYRNFAFLVSCIKKYGRHLKLITFTTNGLNPHKALEYALQLKELGTDLFITISLDGDAKNHDYIRGVPGNYKRAWQTYSLLKENGILVHWGLTASSLNQDYVQEGNPELSQFKAITFAHSGGIYEQENAQDDNRLSEQMKVLAKNYRITSLGEIVEWLYLKLSYRFLISGQQMAIPCEVISTNVHIRSNGYVQPCMFVEKIGDLAKQSLNQILAEPSIYERMDKYRKGDCPKCWMNCYAPHSMMQHPLKALYYSLRSYRAKS
ncbi:MAG: radical SAM protein [Bdellovibrio sp.]